MVVLILALSPLNLVSLSILTDAWQQDCPQSLPALFALPPDEKNRDCAQRQSEEQHERRDNDLER